MPSCPPPTPGFFRRSCRKHKRLADRGDRSWTQGRRRLANEVRPTRGTLRQDLGGPTGSLLEKLFQAGIRALGVGFPDFSGWVGAGWPDGGLGAASPVPDQLFQLASSRGRLWRPVNPSLGCWSCAKFGESGIGRHAQVLGQAEGVRVLGIRTCSARTMMSMSCHVLGTEGRPCRRLIVGLSPNHRITVHEHETGISVVHSHLKTHRWKEGGRHF